MSVRIPTYRYHKARACAVVTIRGRDHYLGLFNSPESREAYHRLVAEFLAEKARPAATSTSDPHPFTVVELVAQYIRFATGYYQKDDRPTGEMYPLKRALALLRRLYGRTPAAEFTPAKLKAVREAMLVEPVTRRVKVVDPATGTTRVEDKVIQVGWSRRVVNKQVGRIKRVFGWAVAQELVPPAVASALGHVDGLKRGRSAAREKPRVGSVDAAVVDKTLPHLPPVVKVMATVQRLTGCRPQEVVLMRAEEVDTGGPVWEYRPGRYKTEHHNPDADPDRARVVYLGPLAQAALAPFLGAGGTEFVFSPARSEKLRRGPNSKTRRVYNDRYTVHAYRQAVVRACKQAGVRPWTPNQLRHLRLTELRRGYGLEASRVCGGHREVGVTQVYAERDHDLARRVMAEAG
ncbi:tyrosine-type recombinase/integrase [Urbifossiella limnaea]|uniref:Phage integrase family protein n=1 Tax=Urbifossiella limnaea TaxID=2528023 RepID=A0A517XU49_9BACT|nr:tyrosine-type recombinase/integrase [Urbifossiella limnaea]QDU21039.1 Phage integrase family protein [Urbifossiella limnaea]